MSLPQPLLDHIRIVLVEPQGPLNIGSTCRAMKNFGLKDLVLVRPGCDVKSLDCTKMALSAVDILERAPIVETIPDAVTGSRLILGTANRRGEFHEPGMTVREGLKRIQEVIPQGTVSILFGREEWGLTKKDLPYCQGTIRVVTAPEFTSLNLAQAVLLVSYELYQEFGEKVLLPKTHAKDPMEQAPTFEELDRLFKHMDSVLTMCEFLPRVKPEDLFQVIRGFFSRSKPIRREIAILMGIFSNVNGFMKKYVRRSGGKPPNHKIMK